MYLLITVDTEGFGYPPNKSCYYGEYKGKEYGIRTMMDICEKYNFPITFFLDIYEIKIHGVDFFREMCREIKYRGHDIQLHTHPRWAFDPNREFMTKYNLTEQEEILLWGKEYINKLFGSFPIAYRAGSYNFNSDTLVALKNTNFVFDNSIYHGHYFNTNNFTEELIKKNVFDVHGDIVMVPISQYNFYRQVKLTKKIAFDVNTHLFKKKIPNKKIDLDIMSINEFSFILQEFIEKTQVVTFFMHSMSFLNRLNGGKDVSPNIFNKIRFECMMRELNNSKIISVIDFKELLKLKNKDVLDYGQLSFQPSFIEKVYFKDIFKRPFSLPDIFRYRTYYK